MLVLLLALACSVDSDGDGYFGVDDCGADDPSVHPGATEWCNGIDDDCNARIDVGAADALTVFTDGDGDGAGDPEQEGESCTLEPGLSEDAADCDDARADVHPGAKELCNGRDDDCDGSIDVGAGDLRVYFTDSDGDGYGDAAEPIEACARGPGMTDREGDCDDGAAGILPGAIEHCDGVDEDCDGTADDDAVDRTVWYQDADADGFGDPSKAQSACERPDGWVLDDTDCDDDDGIAHPTGVEVCNLIDDDCDGVADEDAVDRLTYNVDADGDGFGSSKTTLVCTGGAGLVLDNTDCDDAQATVHPGEIETCGTAYDDDCDAVTNVRDAPACTTFHADSDADGLGTPDTQCWCVATDVFTADQPGDCDDFAALIGGPSASYPDNDGDGFGGAPESLDCVRPAGHIVMKGDCDDNNDAAHPGLIEECGNITDENCDHAVPNCSRTGSFTAVDLLLRFDSPPDDFAIGDADGDPWPDLLMGQTSTQGGLAYLIHGPITNGMTVADAEAMYYGVDVWTWQKSQMVGLDVAFGGDLTGDGFPDVVVADPGVDDGYSDSGAVYVFRGLSVGSYSVHTGAYATIVGDDHYQETGNALADGPTDVDGDGVDDLVLGATGYGTPYAQKGGAFIFRGPLVGRQPVSAATFRLLGVENDSETGSALATGDFDGDGLPDVAIGARYLRGTYGKAGGVYVVLAPFPTSMPLSAADALLKAVDGGEQAGSALATGGDVNGDGLEDLLVGARTMHSATGGAYLVTSPLTSGSLASARATFLGTTMSERSGEDIALGDTNGDDLADVIIGSPDYDHVSNQGDNWGRVDIITGPVDGTWTLGTIGAFYDGTLQHGYCGQQVAAGQDMDGDGLTDVAVTDQGFIQFISGSLGP